LRYLSPRVFHVMIARLAGLKGAPNFMNVRIRKLKIGKSPAPGD
jgi:hypothetical protein